MAKSDYDIVMLVECHKSGVCWEGGSVDESDIKQNKIK